MQLTESRPQHRSPRGQAGLRKRVEKQKGLRTGSGPSPRKTLRCSLVERKKNALIKAMKDEKGSQKNWS